MICPFDALFISIKNIILKPIFTLGIKINWCIFLHSSIEYNLSQSTFQVELDSISKQIIRGITLDLIQFLHQEHCCAFSKTLSNCQSPLKYTSAFRGKTYSRLFLGLGKKLYNGELKKYHVTDSFFANCQFLG